MAEAGTYPAVAAAFERILRRLERGASDPEAYNKRVLALPIALRTIYTIGTLEQEVLNGGFHQYFYNSSGQLAVETVEDLERIGAVRHADVLRKAIEQLGAESEMQQRIREHRSLESFMDSYKETELKPFDTLWGEVDATEPLGDLQAKYIWTNPNEFAPPERKPPVAKNDRAATPGKKERLRAAMVAELARRNAALGVPDHLQVYVLRSYYADEGSPRQFAAMESVARTQRWDSSEPNPLPDLIEAARIHGKPIQMVADDAAVYERGTPYTDFCTCGEMMVFSRRAAEAIRHLLEPCGAFLPLACGEADLVGYQLMATEDVLDVEKAGASWDDPKTRRSASTIYTYAFRTDQLGRSAIFRVPQDSAILVLQSLVDVVRRHNFAGFCLSRVWPMVTGENWGANKV